MIDRHGRVHLRLGLLACYSAVAAMWMSAALCFPAHAALSEAASRIIASQTSIVGSTRKAAMSHLQAMSAEDITAALQELMGSAAELPEYLMLHHVFSAASELLGDEDGTVLLGEWLLGEDGELALELIRDRMPPILPYLDTPAHWRLLTRAAEAAPSEAVREAARGALGYLARGSETFTDFAPTTALGFYYRASAGMRWGSSDRDRRAEALDAALSDFDQAIALDSQLLQAYVLKGRTHIALKQYGEAIDVLSNAIDLDPGFGVYQSPDIGSEAGYAYRLRQDAYHALGDAEAAEANGQSALECERAAYEAHRQSERGLTEAHQGAQGAVRQHFLMRAKGSTSNLWRDQALEHLDTLIRYDTAYPTAQLERGLFRLLLGDAEGAVADLQAYVDARPDLAYPHLLLSRAHEALGHDGASEQASRAYRDLAAAYSVPHLPGRPPGPTTFDVGLSSAGLRDLTTEAEQHVEALATALLDPGVDEATWATILKSLLQLTPEALTPAVPFVSQATMVGPPHRMGKGTELEVLSKAGDARSVPYLLWAACGSDTVEAPAYRELAVEAIGALPDELAAPALLTLIVACEETSIALEATRVLAGVVQRSGVDPRVDAILRAPRAVQVRAAARARHSPLALPLLLEVLDDPITLAELRREASDALRRSHGARLADWALERMAQP